MVWFCFPADISSLLVSVSPCKWSSPPFFNGRSSSWRSSCLQQPIPVKPFLYIFPLVPPLSLPLSSRPLFVCLYLCLCSFLPTHHHSRRSLLACTLPLAALATLQHPSPPPPPGPKPKYARSQAFPGLSPPPIKLSAGSIILPSFCPGIRPAFLNGRNPPSNPYPCYPHPQHAYRLQRMRYRWSYWYI